MYVPSSFRVSMEEAQEIISHSRLSTLVTFDVEKGLTATHLPLRLNRDEGPYGTLYGHIAKANKQWRSEPQHDVLTIFQGADAYISPTWYTTKPIDGKVVPTWDYESIHAYGPIEFFTDKEKLHEVVSSLTGKYERSHSQWTVSDAPDKYVDAQLKAIVGVRIPISRIEGAVKMSQNKKQNDVDSISRGLAASGSQNVADLVQLASSREQ